MVKYKTGRDNEINKVEVIRETTKSVFLQWGSGETREAKRGPFTDYFDTWNEAWQYLKERAQLRIDSSRIGLARREKELRDLTGMRE